MRFYSQTITMHSIFYFFLCQLILLYYKNCVKNGVLFSISWWLIHGEFSGEISFINIQGIGELCCIDFFTLYLCLVPLLLKCMLSFYYIFFESGLIHLTNNEKFHCKVNQKMISSFHQVTVFDPIFVWSAMYIFSLWYHLS